MGLPAKRRAADQGDLTGRGGFPGPMNPTIDWTSLWKEACMGVSVAAPNEAGGRASPRTLRGLGWWERRDRRGADQEDHPMAMTNESTSRRTRNPTRRTSHKGRSEAKEAKGPTRPKAHRKGKAGRATRPQAKRSKKQICLDLLSRASGANIEELQKATGWQAHSVRGFLAATVKKMPGVTLVSEKSESGPRRYRVEAAGE